MAKARAKTNADKELLEVLRELSLRYGITAGEAYEGRRGERLAIQSPKDVVNLLSSEMACLVQEQLRVITLTTKNDLISQTVVYQGNVNSSIIRAAEIYRQAIIENAPSIIIVHNHPSGDPTPSPEDLQVTRDLVAAGKLLGIDLLDHIVIAGNRFVSLNEAQAGLLGGATGRGG